jgi:hypothetical protein
MKVDDEDAGVMRPSAGISSSFLHYRLPSAFDSNNNCCKAQT